MAAVQQHDTRDLTFDNVRGASILCQALSSGNAAIDAALCGHFTPAEQDDQPIAVRVQVPIDFTLN